MFNVEGGGAGDCVPVGALVLYRDVRGWLHQNLCHRYYRNLSQIERQWAPRITSVGLIFSQAAVLTTKKERCMPQSWQGYSKPEGVISYSREMTESAKRGDDRFWDTVIVNYVRPWVGRNPRRPDLVWNSSWAFTGTSVPTSTELSEWGGHDDNCFIEIWGGWPKPLGKKQKL